MTVRAKFRLGEITQTAGVSGTKYVFWAVCADEIPENQRYHKWTPSGRLEITVNNPAVSFELGQQYYLDFVPVSQPEQPSLGESESAALAAASDEGAQNQSIPTTDQDSASSDSSATTSPETTGIDSISSPTASPSSSSETAPTNPDSNI